MKKTGESGQTAVDAGWNVAFARVGISAGASKPLRHEVSRMCRGRGRPCGATFVRRQQLSCGWQKVTPQWVIGISRSNTPRRRSVVASAPGSSAKTARSARRARIPQQSRQPQRRKPKRPQPVSVSSLCSKQDKAGRQRRVVAGKIGWELAQALPYSLRGHETVVVVDEDSGTRVVLARLLEGLGYRVLQAANGLEAQRLAVSERRIDVLLAGFSALGASGVRLIRWFAGHRPDTNVLVASEWLWEVESFLGDLPRVGVLAKNFTPSELARMVRAILK